MCEVYGKVKIKEYPKNARQVRPKDTEGPVSMLITLPRGYEKCPFGSLLSFIHIMYFHIHGIRSRVEQGAP